MKPFNIVLIVRRYGPVGGMERYVWEISREMAALGHQITILCEQLLAEPTPDKIRVIELGAVSPKPRWLAHLRFSARVSTWLTAHPEADRIIHSHERTAEHQFTTFHGPPFASVKQKPWWQRISPRIYANLWLERRELCAPQVRAIIPNSPLIADALCRYYPSVAAHLTDPIAPGVGDIPPRPNRQIPANGGVIGFVGKEWKRKGLDIAVAIVATMRQQRPEIEFIVVGPEPEAVRPLFREWRGGYTLMGETDATPLYAQFDLLLHPARQEPYGMVIAEAQAAGVPVLISDACGIAANLNPEMVLSAGADVSEWVRAAEQRIATQPTIVTRHWRTVAEEQLACYEKHNPAADNMNKI